MTAIPNTLPLPTPAEMAACDATAIDEFGLRQEVLMETAGRGAFAVIEEAFDDLDGLRALVVAGSGNNGGDAFVIARCLADAGVQVLVLHSGPKKKYRGAAAGNMRLAQAMGIPLEYLHGRDMAELAAQLGDADIIVDGLLGTGFSGELRQAAQGWINTLNALGQTAFVLAVDIPSGLNGETGVPQPVAVHADATATFQAAKLGLVQPGADAFTGEVHVVPIGIPGFIMRSAPARCELLTHGTALLAPLPTPGMHKGRGGHALVVGGSPGLTGAPLLAALGALRSGAGLATIACPSGVATEAKAATPDVMTLPLGRGTAWTAAMAEELAPRLSGYDAMALGPGMGRDERTLEFLESLAQSALPPYVADADALFWLARKADLFAPTPPAVMTPHPGEAARLLDTDTSTVQADRITAAREMATRYGVVTILKGAGTIVAAPEGGTWLAPFDTPALAVAGSGDVLSGLIASLLAKGLAPAEAACLAVYWHGTAGELLEPEYPLRGGLASEIAAALPLALEELFDAAR